MVCGGVDVVSRGVGVLRCWCSGVLGCWSKVSDVVRCESAGTEMCMGCMCACVVGCKLAVPLLHS